MHRRRPPRREPRRRDFHLNIAGTGVPAYRAELEAIRTRENLTDAVTFLGKIPHTRMASVYQAHHELVFPSEWQEPFGLSHIEAMVCGTAEISTITGGSAELIRHGQNALAFYAGDVADLEAQLRILLDSAPERQRLLNGGRSRVEKHHSLRGYVDRIEESLGQYSGLGRL